MLDWTISTPKRKYKKDKSNFWEKLYLSLEIKNTDLIIHFIILYKSIISVITVITASFHGTDLFLRN
jgi:hypothetical protein